MEYINEYSYRRVHLGLVASCKKGDLYGLLYGIRQIHWDGKKKGFYDGGGRFENKLVYFEKSPELEITKNTLVSYLSYDYNEFNEFSPKVEYVYPITSWIIHTDKRGTYRDDKVYHDDETWRLINEGIPYFDYEKSRQYCIHYPIIKDNVCTIYRGLFGCGMYMDKEAVIYEMYNELISINYGEWPTLEEIANTITTFKEQIDSINAFEIIDKFEIKKICFYKTIIGKDDQYWEDLEQKLPHDDKFLQFLLPTKRENVFFVVYAYRSYGYKNEEIFMKEETMEAIKKAKVYYSKEKHLAFLINDYFSDAIKKKNRAEVLKKEIEEEFDIINAKKITSLFKGNITDDFITLINDYNKSINETEYDKSNISDEINNDINYEDKSNISNQINNDINYENIEDMIDELASEINDSLF